MIWGTEADQLLKDYLKEYAKNNNLIIKTSVRIPQGLDSDNPYYNTMSGYGFADIIYVNNGTAEVYELKHESAYGRIYGSLQLNGYIWAIEGNKNESYWINQNITKGATVGSGIDSAFVNLELESNIHGGKKIRYYTSGIFPGMVFWTYADRDPEDTEFVKVLKEDAEELKKKMNKLLEKEGEKGTIRTVAELVVLVFAAAIVLGDDAAGMVFDNAALIGICALIVAKWKELFGSCDTSA